MLKDNSDKFNWNEGDIKAEISQCANCTYNISPLVCTEFPEKPDDYAINIEICPERKEAQKRL